LSTRQFLYNNTIGLSKHFFGYTIFVYTIQISVKNATSGRNGKIIYELPSQGVQNAVTIFSEKSVLTNIPLNTQPKEIPE